MKKLYRSALVAGVLALGVAACGDDVTIVEPEPTPPPPLSVTLTPANQSIVVGETADFAVGISGGSDAAQSSWTCSSSASGVASVATTDTGCRATGAAAGNASITVTVTKGNQSANAGAQVVVAPAEGEGVAATVSIGQITKGGLTQPVDIDNVFGQIDVSLNVNPNDQTVTRVQVLVDGDVAAEQVLTTGGLEMEAMVDETGEALQVITLSFDTGDYEVDEDANSATPSYLNGEREIQARIFVEEAPEEPAASNVITLNFNNDDGFHVLAEDDGNTAVDTDGLFWRGGPDFSIEVTPIPVMYSGGVVTQMTTQLRRLQSGPWAGVEACATPSANVNRDIDSGSDLDFDFSCSNVEADMFVPYVTTVVAPGEAGPSIGGSDISNYAGVLNLSESDDHPFPARLDTRAPQVVDATDWTYRLVRQPGLDNTGNWLNDQYNFGVTTGTTSARTFNRSNVADGGVSETSNWDALYAVSTNTSGTNIVAGPSATLTGADLAAAVGAGVESVTNTAYYAWGIAEDRLENRNFFRQEVNAPDHSATSRSFGYDATEPLLVMSDDSTEVGVFVEQYSIVDNLNAGDQIAAEATDNASGFNLMYAANHGIVGVRGMFEGNGAQERNNVVGTGSTTPNTFATVRAGNRINTLADISAANLSYITQTALTIEVPSLGTLPGLDPARYYVYQLELRDQAGNFVRDYRGTYVNNGSDPRIENLTRPAAFTADAAFNVGLVTDSVEVLEGHLEIAYPNIGGTLVWERPGAAVSSVLRMNADILDGELFNDVIYRPQMDVDFPMGLDAFGLPFLRSIQALGSGTTNSKPDSARVRIYNGFAASDEDVNATTANAAGDGISEFEVRTLPAEAIDNASTNYTTVFGGASFEIVRGDGPGVEDCNAEYCVRAIGPQSTFTNPFPGGSVLIVWADDAAAFGPLEWRVFTVATPNFNGEFPTRDSGDDRIYEWTFSLGGLNTGDLDGEVTIAAIGVRPNGDAVVSQYAPDPFFNIMFDGGPFTVEAGSNVVMDLIHGSNSTGGGFLVQCFFTNDDGDRLAFAPVGSELTLTPGAESCDLAAGAAAPAGEYQIMAVGTQGADESETVTTVTVTRPAFAISIAGPGSNAIPNAGDPAIDYNYPVVATSGGPINQLVCSISPTTGASVAAVAGDCVVTLDSDAVDGGTYTVTANAQEDVSGAEATDFIQFTADRTWDVDITPATTMLAPAMISWADNDLDFDIAVTGSLTNADIDLVTSTCSITPATGMTATLVDLGGGVVVCEVRIDDYDLAAEGPYTVDVDLNLVGGNTYSETVYAELGERPDFAPTFDIPTSPFGTEPGPREVERDRTVNFVIEGDSGLGIDFVASTVTISPNQNAADPLVDIVAALTDDGAGVDILQVTVPENANAGNLTVTVTFVEENSGEEVEVLVYIRVIDTGTDRKSVV